MRRSALEEKKDREAKAMTSYADSSLTATADTTLLRELLQYLLSKS